MGGEGRGGGEEGREEEGEGREGRGGGGRGGKRRGRERREEEGGGRGGKRRERKERQEEGEGGEARGMGGTGEHKVNTYVAELVNTILLLYLHGSRQSGVHCVIRIIAPAGNMSLIEPKGAVAYNGPEERATSTAWTKTVLHSPRSGGAGAGTASSDGHIAFSCALSRSNHCKRMNAHYCILAE